MLEVKNITTVLENGFSLEDISFEVAKDEYFVLLGPSGVGKTVLLETIAGMYTPSSGQIIMNGKDITADKIQNRKIGLVYQDRVLFPHLSVYNNIAFGMQKFNYSKDKMDKNVLELANETEVSHLLDRMPETLSGGEYQRVSLARALAPCPEYLLLDEPLSALDVQLRAQMRGLLRRINRHGQAIIHVTHDYEEAISLATKMAVMNNAKIHQIGLPEEICTNPKTSFVAGFVGIKNFFKGSLINKKDSEISDFRTEKGEISLATMTNEPEGEGYVAFRPEDVIITIDPIKSSARNCFKGKVFEIIPAALGLEVFVDIGVPVVALVTKESINNLDIKINNFIWIEFKATAIKFYKH